jgi:hypothetical protein
MQNEVSSVAKEFSRFVRLLQEPQDDEPELKSGTLLDCNRDQEFGNVPKSKSFT